MSPTNVTIPKNILNNLKCATCNLYLSVPPIEYHQSAENKLTCGRCTDGSGKRKRNVAYELVASLFSFPCRYSEGGCRESSLTWEQVKSHEDVCKFGPVNCPMFTIPMLESNCRWKGMPAKLFDHFNTEHSDRIVYSNKILVSLEEGKSILLAKTNLKVYLIYFEVDDSGMARFLVRMVDSNVAKGEFEIKISDDLQRSSWKTKHKIQPYNSDISETNKINIKFLKDCMNSTNINCTLTFTENLILDKGLSSKVLGRGLTDGNDEATTNRIKLKKNWNDILRELECPVCFNYMKAPIVVCQNGHSGCSSCVRNSNTCFVCEADIMKGTRNFSLEKISPILKEITNEIEHSCKYEEGGCKTTGKITYVMQHEKDCRFGVVCPQNYSGCTWRGLLKNQISHLEEHRSNNWINSNELVCHDLDDSESTISNILSHEGQLFRVTFKQTLIECEWKFHHIGLRKTELSPYRVDITLFPQGENKVAITYTGTNCYGFSNDFYEPFNLRRVTKASIRSFINNGSLHVKYKVVIVHNSVTPVPAKKFKSMP